MPARVSIASAMSIPITEPVGPTIEAAGRADAPVPQTTSRTLSPGRKLAWRTARRPCRSQKLSGGQVEVVSGGVVGCGDP